MDLEQFIEPGEDNRDAVLKRRACDHLGHMWVRDEDRRRRWWRCMRDFGSYGKCEAVLTDREIACGAGARAAMVGVGCAAWREHFGRIARYLGWWLADLDIEHGARPPEAMPPFVPDGDAHEVCRESGYLVYEVRGVIGRWWMTPIGEALARTHASRLEVGPVVQLGLFGMEVSS